MTVKPNQYIGTSSELGRLNTYSQLTLVLAKEETAGQPTTTTEVEKLIHLCLSFHVCAASSERSFQYSLHAHGIKFLNTINIKSHNKMY